MAVRVVPGGLQSYDPSRQSVTPTRRTPSGAGGSSGSSRNRGGGSSSRRSTPTPEPTVSINNNTVFIDGKGFTVAPELQETFIREQTGGRGSSSQKAISKARSNLVEAIALNKANSIEASKESLRIRNLQKVILQRGGTKSVRERNNTRTEVVQSNRTGQRVVTTTNLITGVENIVTFEVPKGGGSMQQSGGLVRGAPSKAKQEQKSVLDKRIDELQKRINAIKNKANPTFNERALLKALKVQLRNLNKKLERGIGVGTFTKAEDPTRLDKLIQTGTTNRLRGKTSVRGEAIMVGLGLASTVVDTVGLVRQAPAIYVAIMKDPSGIISQVPRALLQSGAEFGEMLRINPSFALGRFAGDVFIFKGTGKVFKVTGKLTKRGARMFKDVKFSRLKNKVYFSPTKVKTPTLKIKSVAQMKREARKIAIKKAKALKNDVKSLNIVESKMASDKIDDLVERLAKRWEDANEIKLQTVQRTELKRAIRKTLQRRSAGRMVDVGDVNKLARSKTTIKDLLKRIKPKKRPTAKAKRIKKAKQIKQRKLDRDFVSAEKERMVERAIDNEVERLTKAFEKSQGVRYETIQRTDLKRLIRNKLKGGSGKRASVSEVKRLASNKKTMNELFKKVKIKKRPTAKAKRIKKVKQIKQRKLDRDFFDIEDTKRLTNKLDDEVEGLTRALEKRQGVRYETIQRTDIKKTIKKMLENRRTIKKVGGQPKQKIKVQRKQKMTMKQRQALKEQRGTVKKLLNKIDDASGNTLNTAQKTDIKKRILKQLDEGIDPDKLKRLLGTNVKKPVVKVSRTKPTPRKRVKTLKDFASKGDDAGGVQVQGSKQQQLLMQKQKVITKPRQKMKVKRKQKMTMKQRQALKRKKALMSKQKQELAQKQAQKLKQKKKAKLRTEQLQRVRTASKFGLAGASALRQKSRTKQVLRSKQISKQKQVSRTKQAQGSKTKTITTTAQTGQSRVAQAQAVAQKSKTPTRTKQKQIRTPTPRPPLPKPKPKRIKQGLAKKKLETGFVSSYSRGRKTRSVNSVPVARSRAFDVLAYSLNKYKLDKGIVSKSTKQVELSVLKRKLGKVPTGYFSKNRKRFTVRRLKTKQEAYEVKKRK